MFVNSGGSVRSLWPHYRRRHPIGAVWPALKAARCQLVVWRLAQAVNPYRAGAHACSHRERLLLLSSWGRVHAVLQVVFVMCTVLLCFSLVCMSAARKPRSAQPRSHTLRKRICTASLLLLYPLRPALALHTPMRKRACTCYIRPTICKPKPNTPAP